MKTHHYSVKVKKGERVKYFFNSSKPVDFLFVFSIEEWPDTNYLEPSDVVLVNETLISFYSGEFKVQSGGYLSFHFSINPPESSVIYFDGAYLWPFKRDSQPSYQAWNTLNFKFHLAPLLDISLKNS